MLKKISQLSLFLIMPLFVGCGGKKNLSVLKVAVSADHPPTEFYDPKSNKVVGFDIELMERIGKELGKTVEIVDMDFAGILPALQSGRIDAAISSITRTKEREEAIDFTDEYYRPQFAFLTREGTEIAAQSHLSGKKIGCQLGSAHEMMLNGLKDTVGFEVKSLTRVTDLVQELKTERVDAVLLDLPAVMRIIQENESLDKAAFYLRTDRGYAIALPKGSKLKDPINKVLQQLKREVFYQALENKWFFNQNVKE